MNLISTWKDKKIITMLVLSTRVMIQMLFVLTLEFLSFGIFNYTLFETYFYLYFVVVVAEKMIINIVVWLKYTMDFTD